MQEGDRCCVKVVAGVGLVAAVAELVVAGAELVVAGARRRSLVQNW